MGHSDSYRNDTGGSSRINGLPMTEPNKALEKKQSKEPAEKPVSPEEGHPTAVLVFMVAMLAIIVWGIFAQE